MTQPQHRSQTADRGRFVDPEQLICPGCGEQVRPEPPGYWLVAWGLPAADFSHQDATALCLMRATGCPAEPVETDRA